MPAHCLHYLHFLSALPALFACTTYTYLHTVCTYLHLLAPSSLYTSAPVCMMGHTIHTFRHRGNDFWIRATETTTSRNCLTVRVRTLRHAAWQQSGGSVCVQTSAEKSEVACRWKIMLPTHRNRLKISAVQAKSARCRQIVQLKKYG